MKKRMILTLIAIPLVFSQMVRADEGMWMVNLLNQLDYGELTEMGLKLSPEDIYDINHSSLKDAIVIFGGGCTGEMISDKGLLLTNMHCGYGRIQAHTTVENDYLKNGFWAQSMDDELLNPGLQVRFLRRIEDVSEQVQNRLSTDMTERERQREVRKVSKELEEQVVEGTHYSATVRPFYEGNAYYMMVYETYKDVRLVASPPTSIGDFGSLTDNWMWPRHKADFSMFRVYMSPDGEPAEYSRENVPYRPKHHLPVSMEGVEEGDFAMIMGYPGNTDRFMTSYGIRELKEISHPNRIHIRGKKLDIMKKIMNKSPEHRIMYASKYKGTSNYWKYSIGQMEGFERIDLLYKRTQLEKEFIEWINGHSERERQYVHTMDLIQKAYESRREYENAGQYLRETLMSGPEIIGFARSTDELKSLLEQSFFKRLFGRKEIKKEINQLRERASRHFRDYHRPTDQEIAETLWSMFRENIDQRFYPELFGRAMEQYRGDVEGYVEHLYTSSLFTDQGRFEAFLEDPDAETLEKDPVYQLSNSVYNQYYHLRDRSSQYDNQLQRGQRLFVKGIGEMQSDQTFYPDANSTMRLTYGTVGGYKARDAVRYKYYTTLEGVMEKEDPDNYEFIVPDKLKALYRKKDYGRYGEDGHMPVCFITNNDITGGNSGSPVMNGKGELIGLAFDSNWEGMTGDIEFEEGMQKTVSTDIRYLLFILDKFGEVDWLIEEMDIVDE
ncbi:MAG: S46 family peptidase [Bacteroidales bacterium]|nr:S46 family peptidase [Bacteroidales bacterium]